MPLVKLEWKASVNGKTPPVLIGCSCPLATEASVHLVVYTEHASCVQVWRIACTSQPGSRRRWTPSRATCFTSSRASTGSTRPSRSGTSAQTSTCDPPSRLPLFPSPHSVGACTHPCMTAMTKGVRTVWCQPLLCC